MNANSRAPEATDATGVNDHFPKAPPMYDVLPSNSMESLALQQTDKPTEDSDDLHIYEEILLDGTSNLSHSRSDTLYEELEDDCDIVNCSYLNSPSSQPPKTPRKPTALRLEVLSADIQQTLNDLQLSSSPPKVTVGKKSWLRRVKTFLTKHPISEVTSARTAKSKQSLKRVTSAPIPEKYKNGLHSDGDSSTTPISVPVRKSFDQSTEPQNSNLCKNCSL